MPNGSARVVETVEALDQSSRTQLEDIGRSIVQTFGEGSCEVVIHEFRSPSSSIVFIAGNVTNRTVGGSMSQIGFAMLNEGSKAEARLNYITKTRDGKVLKSTTIPLRNQHGAVWGAFCLNVDITLASAFADHLRPFVSSAGAPILDNVHFGNDVTELATVMIEETRDQIGLSGPPRTTSESVEFVHALEKKGFFAIRNSVPLLGQYLGLSRATIYGYLNSGKGHK